MITGKELKPMNEENWCWWREVDQQWKEKLMLNGESVFCKISDKIWGFGVWVIVNYFIYKSGLFSEEKVSNWFVHNRRFWELKKVQDSEFLRSFFASCWSLRKLNTCRQQMNTTNSRTAQTRISVAKNFCIIVPWPGAFLLLWNSLKKVGFYLIRFHLTDHHFLSIMQRLT